jgi:hypothetical protein
VKAKDPLGKRNRALREFCGSIRMRLLDSKCMFSCRVMCVLITLNSRFFCLHVQWPHDGACLQSDVHRASRSPPHCWQVLFVRVCKKYNCGLRCESTAWNCHFFGAIRSNPPIYREHYSIPICILTRLFFPSRKLISVNFSPHRSLEVMHRYLKHSGAFGSAPKQAELCSDGNIIFISGQ